MNNNTTISLPATAIARLTLAVAALPGARFVGVTYRSKESGELARHTLILGADYNTQVQASRDALAMRPTCEGDATQLAYLDSVVARYAASVKMFADMGTFSPNYNEVADEDAISRLADAKHAKSVFLASLSPERAAAAELFNSFTATLTAHAKGEQNAAYTKAGLYETITPGLVVSRADGTFELHGLSHSKTVIEAGTYKRVNSSPKTLAKQALREALPVGRYRSLSLDANALESVRIGGNEIDVT